MTAPSTDWQESVADDEAERHQAFAQQLTAIQGAVDRKYGPGRAFHRKQALGLSARVEILPGIPQYARAGIFAEPAVFKGFARLSNGAMSPQPDATPDIRGLALSVRGVTGEGALGGETDRQDFLLINRPTFGFRDSRQFATEPFFSAAPIRWGEYAAKVRLLPNERSRRVAPPTDLARDMAERLAAGPVEYALQAQFFVSEEATPIENGRVDWPQDVSEYVTVARVVLPAQDPDSPEGKQLGVQVEQEAFDPWAALAEHRPLGEIMRARKPAYYASQRHRHATGT